MSLLRRYLPYIWLLPLLLFFWKLDYAPFWNPDEGRYAAASYEMAHPFVGSPDWVVPHLDTMARLNKPPLVYWLSGGLFSLFSPSTGLGRLPEALAAFGVGILLFFWGSQAFDSRAGKFAAVIWVTMVAPFVMGRILNTDMLLAFSICLAVYGLWGLLDAKEEEGPPRGLLWPTIWAGLGLGLAMLAKGPVGVGIPLLVVFFTLVLTRRWRQVPWGALLGALVLGAIVSAPWYIAAQMRRPDFFHIFFYEENFARFSGSKNFHGHASKFYYIPVLLLGMLPWTGFLPAALSVWANGARERRARVFLLVWAVFIFGFFSLSDTKLVSYVLPAFPAVALLTGAGLARWESVPKWWRTAALYITAIFYVILIVAVAAFLPDGKMVPPAVGRPFGPIIAVILLAGLGALLLRSRSGTSLPVVAVQTVTGVALFLALISLATRAAKYEDGSALYIALAPQLQPDDLVVGYGCFLPTALFYTRRPNYFFGFKNTSGLRDDELEKSAYFPRYTVDREARGTRDQEMAADGQALVKLIKGRRAFVISHDAIQADLEQRLHFWGRNNDYFLYSTQPRPDSFHFDYVAPRRRYQHKP